MRTYVRTQKINGVETVAEVITTADDIATLYHPDFVAGLIDATDLAQRPGQWWTYDGKNFSPPA